VTKGTDIRDQSANYAVVPQNFARATPTTCSPMTTLPQPRGPLRDADSLVKVGADGLVLAGPDGPCKRILGDLVRLPGTPGYHRQLTPAGATVALTP
jgi:hypothetical protein